MPQVPIIMPQLGESIAEATVISLLVKPGDMVEADQDVLEVETNKATMNVTAPGPGRIEKFLARLAATRQQRSVGAYPAAKDKRAFYLFELRHGADLAQLLPNVPPLQRDLDVVLLHDGILEPALGITLQAATRETNLTYEREASAAIAAVDSGRAQVSFFLNPVEVEKVVEIATGNEVMPQKSTDFYPKLMRGITMYRVET